MQGISPETVNEINEAMKSPIESLFENYKELYTKITASNNEVEKKALQDQIDLIFDKMEINGIDVLSDERLAKIEAGVYSQENKAA